MVFQIDDSLSIGTFSKTRGFIEDKQKTSSFFVINSKLNKMIFLI